VTHATGQVASSMPYGTDSMVGPLDQVLVATPGDGFAAGFDDPAYGFRHPVDLALARRQHDALVALLTRLGVTVHRLGADASSPDLVYQFDPSLVTARGAVLLRSGKATRRGEEDLQAAWFTAHGIPILGRIEPPGTVDGGDVCRLRSDVVCVGRSLRTNQDGIDQLAALLDMPVRVFDVPYDAGDEACLHLLSVISPVTDALAVVELPRLPSGLYRLLVELGYTLLPVPADEVDSLGGNVLVVRPGVVILCEGNPRTAALLRERGIEVHTFPGSEICWNGSGGPTCLTLPVRRGRASAGGSNR
jgi:dimethylargininase